jgi:hypothetical protein
MPGELAEVGRGLAARLRYLRRMARRASALPMAARGLVWLLGCAAMLLAWPPEVVTGSGVLVLLVPATASALSPGGRWPSVTVLAAALGWVATTTAYGYPARPSALLVLAGVLYLFHQSAALTAHLPYDAVVSASVLVRGLLRAVLVVLGASVVSLGLLLVPAYLGGRVYLLAAVAGLLLTVLLPALLGRLVRR